MNIAAKSLQPCPTLSNPMDCSPPASSVHGILQAKILEWVAMASSRGSSQSRDWTRISYISCFGRQILYHQLHPGSPYIYVYPPLFWISFWNHFPLGSVWDKWTWYREPRTLDDFQMHCMTFPRQLHWLDRAHGFLLLWVPSPKSLLVCF